MPTSVASSPPERCKPSDSGVLGLALAHQGFAPASLLSSVFARDFYAGYDVYRERAGDRRIPVVVLRPR